MTATEGFMKAQIEHLEKENKNLKLIQETNEKQIKNDIKERDELRLQIADLMGERDGKQMRIEKLEEENRKLKENITSWEGRCYDLEQENRKLKEELSIFDREYFDEDKKYK